MPRSTSEDRYFESSGADCIICGAGSHNGYEHRADCVINLPHHAQYMLDAWRSGRDARRALRPDGGEAPPMPPNLSREERVAFSMGSNFAGIQMLEETVKARMQKNEANPSSPT